MEIVRQVSSGKASSMEEVVLQEALSEALDNSPEETEEADVFDSVGHKTAETECEETKLQVEDMEEDGEECPSCFLPGVLQYGVKQRRKNCANLYVYPLFFSFLLFRCI